jgi:hypothetical protein
MLVVFRDKIVTKGGREKGFGMAGLDSGCLILANAEMQVQSFRLNLKIKNR